MVLTRAVILSIFSVCTMTGCATAPAKPSAERYKLPVSTLGMVGLEAIALRDGLFSCDVVLHNPYSVSVQFSYPWISELVATARIYIDGSPWTLRASQNGGGDTAICPHPTEEALLGPVAPGCSLVVPIRLYAPVVLVSGEADKLIRDKLDSNDCIGFQLCGLIKIIPERGAGVWQGICTTDFFWAHAKRQVAVLSDQDRALHEREPSF